MTIRITRTAAARSLAFLGLLVLAGCQTSTAEPTGSTANAYDLTFATNASRIILFDQQECSLAETQATDPEVKQLAAQLLEEANDFQAKLMPAAAAAGITLPDGLDDMRRIRVGHMHLQNGLDFDRTFVEDQIASHQDALDMMEAMPKDNTSQMAQLARAGNAQIALNLRKLQDLQKRL